MTSSNVDINSRDHVIHTMEQEIMFLKGQICQERALLRKSERMEEDLRQDKQYLQRDLQRSAEEKRCITIEKRRLEKEQLRSNTMVHELDVVKVKSAAELNGLRRDLNDSQERLHQVEMELEDLRSTSQMVAEPRAPIARLVLERDQANQERQREFAATEIVRLEQLLKESQDKVAVKDVTIMTQQTQIVEQSKIAQATSEEVDRLSGLLEASEDDIASRDLIIGKQKDRILELVSLVEKEQVPAAASFSVKPESASPRQSKRKASDEIQPSSRQSPRYVTKRELDPFSSHNSDQVAESSVSVHQIRRQVAMAAIKTEVAQDLDSVQDLSDLTDLSTDESDEEDEEDAEEKQPKKRRKQSQGLRKKSKCPWPGCSFITIHAHLNRHMRGHTGERPYHCPICNKGFIDSSALKKHEVVHTGVRPHKCPDCPKAYGLKGALTYHRARKHK
ncbi:hypothetical protein C8J56DRAFT_972545 [Mycena floridula]|nr:hypothetical protein C8J56DRAFT_972545 [Mycena floridula]